ncbi:MBL fold metallo-hydrolase [uncultured Nocardioides sp.]|uniref:MBL fold metallo-hydrolase n=1 Tax=uncultured Nocardioides sp. TaxID=198441 RepID=UPI00262F281C|nr:MBL fold metallo-hydrolase [uncultured Nocardioides sp.]
MSASSTARAVSPDSGAPWSEPGAWPAAPGVHRIPLPLPNDALRAVNVYVLATEQGLTLIDGGWAIAAARDRLESGLASIGAGLRDITRFLVTHAHRDHYTLAAVIARELGTHVSLGAGERANLEALYGVATGERPSGGGTVGVLRRCGAPTLADAWGRESRGMRVDLDEWGHPDTWLDGTESLTVGSRTLDVVPTPGHTRGHVVFADTDAGLLFAGDHVLPTITPSIGFEPAPVENPLGDFLTSLARVRDLPDLRLLPAHGPVTDSSHARVDELLAHHEQRLAACGAAVGASGASGSTAHDVAGALPWTRHARSLTELNTFDAGLATMETRAHLELLAARGELLREDVDGAAVYSSTTA